MPKVTEEDYYRAWQIYTGAAFLNMDDPDNEWQLPKYMDDPERILLRKDAYEQLSNEARAVIDIIVNPSFETLHECSTKTGKLTERSVRIGLNKLLNSKFITKYVLEEIKRWLHQLS